MESSSTQCDYVFSITVIDNVKIPSFSELEISAQVRGRTVNTNSYVLKGNIKNSDVMVAREIVAQAVLFQYTYTAFTLAR